MPKAVSDIGTILTAVDAPTGVAPKTGYTVLVGIRSTPAKGEAPESLDATEMQDEQNSDIPGRKGNPGLEYTFNHTKANISKLKSFQGKRSAFLEVLPEGDGHLITGVMNYWSNGTALNSVHEGTISIVAESIDYIDNTDSYVA